MPVMQFYRKQLEEWIESEKFRYTILGIIIFNAIILGLETSDPIMAVAGHLIVSLDRICLGIFVLELGLKLFAYGPRFFRHGWNIFDTLIVILALIPSSGGLAVLRALRILRVLRVIAIAPSIRRVVEGFVIALPGMTSVFLLMGMLFYIGSVMATKLFGESFDLWFGTLGRSGYSLFQIMTLESWSMGIVRPVMAEYPYAWAFFVPFILVTTFAVVNLLVGLIVNSMQAAHSEEEIAATDSFREEILARLDKLQLQLDKIENQNKRPEAED